MHDASVSMPYGLEVSMNHVDTVYVGAAEAFKVGSKDREDFFTKADYKACARARGFFEGFTDKQMAFALLICMYDLGERLSKAENACKITTNLPLPTDSTESPKRGKFNKRNR